MSTNKADIRLQDLFQYNPDAENQAKVFDKADQVFDRTRGVLQQCVINKADPGLTQEIEKIGIVMNQMASDISLLLSIGSDLTQGVNKIGEELRVQEDAHFLTNEKVVGKLDSLKNTIGVIVGNIAGNQATSKMSRALHATLDTMRVLYGAIGRPSKSGFLSPNNIVFATLRAICVFFEVSILLILLEIVIKTDGLPENTLDILVKVIFSGLTTVFVRLFQLLFTHDNPLLRLIKVGGNTVFENAAVGNLLTIVNANMAAVLSGLKSGLGIDKILEALAVIKAVPGQAMNAAASAVNTVKDTIENGVITAGSTAFGYLKSQYQRLSLSNQANAANTAAVMIEGPLDTADTADAAKRFADNLVLGFEEVDYSALDLVGIVNVDYLAGGALTEKDEIVMVDFLKYTHMCAMILIAEIVKAIYLLVEKEETKGGKRKRKGKSRKHMKRKTHRRIRNKNKKASKRRYKNKRHSKRRNRK